MAPLYRKLETAEGVNLARNVRRVAALATLVAASVTAGALPAVAQVRGGGHGLYQNELLNGSFGYGGRVEFDLGFLVEQMVIGGNYDRVFPECDECTYWETGGQLGFYSGVGYVGLGVFFSRFENTTAGGGRTIEDDWIFALIGSVRYPLKGFFTPFLEIRNELGEGILNSQTIALGILLGPYGGGETSRTPARGAR